MNNGIGGCSTDRDVLPGWVCSSIWSKNRPCDLLGKSQPVHAHCRWCIRIRSATNLAVPIIAKPINGAVLPDRQRMAAAAEGDDLPYVGDGYRCCAVDGASVAELSRAVPAPCHQRPVALERHAEIPPCAYGHHPSQPRNPHKHAR